MQVAIASHNPLCPTKDSAKLRLAGLTHSSVHAALGPGYLEAQSSGSDFGDQDQVWGSGHQDTRCQLHPNN